MKKSEVLDLINEILYNFGPIENEYDRSHFAELLVKKLEASNVLPPQALSVNFRSKWEKE